jgi:hypothetical protein
MLLALRTLAPKPPTYERGDSYHLASQRKIYVSTQTSTISVTNADVNHLRYQRSVALTNDNPLLRTGSQRVDDTSSVVAQTPAVCYTLRSVLLQTCQCVTATVHSAFNL